VSASAKPTPSRSRAEAPWPKPAKALRREAVRWSKSELKSGSQDGNSGKDSLVDADEDSYQRIVSLEGGNHAATMSFH